ncbi:MAG TPA: arginine--tRNA ligase [Nitriliruptorales bacterium]
MANPEALDPVLADLGVRVREALRAADLPDAEPEFERPKQADHGDWATSIALRLAKPAKANPREIAQAIVDHVALPDDVEAVEIAGPGFVNFRFSHAYFEGVVRRVLGEGDRYGRHTRSQDTREAVNVEFVSSNPTGPLHIGHGRWAALGDSISALLEADGHQVAREYYVNDAGEQVRTFGESLYLAATGQERTEKHYRGDYVIALADELRNEHGDGLFEPGPGDDVTGDDVAGTDVAGDDGLGDPRVPMAAAARVGREGGELMTDHIRRTLHAMGVDFDTWFSELSLHDAGAIDKAIAELREAGHAQDQDGATFLRTTAFGDDKDRVLVRSDGRPTYFAADCAYLRDKWGRADRLIYILGADHHGYVGRMLAAAQCLGIPPEAVEIRIGQMVNLLRGGQDVKMSTRAGEFVTLDEVLDEVGSDVLRYHFLRASMDTTVNFDLEVVTQQSMENPVYYVQYAHARIASLVRKAEESGLEPGDAADADLRTLTHAAELDLLKKMAELPEVIAVAAELRATQRVCRYAEELAATFHRFYTECRILPGTEEGSPDQATSHARYWLAVAAKQVLANALGVLRVAAPERM